MSTYTATILRYTKRAVPLRRLTQAAHLERLFSSYYGVCAAAHTSLKSTANRYYTGSRLLPSELIQHYADTCHPQCPAELYDDIESYISMTHSYPSERLNTQTALVDIIKILPPEDRSEFLCDPLPNTPSTTDLSDLMTRLIWYAVCNDRYEDARKKAHKV